MFHQVKSEEIYVLEMFLQLVEILGTLSTVVTVTVAYCYYEFAIDFGRLAVLGTKRSKRNERHPCYTTILLPPYYMVTSSVAILISMSSYLSRRAPLTALLFILKT